MYGFFVVAETIGKMHLVAITITILSYFSQEITWILKRLLLMEHPMVGAYMLRMTVSVAVAIEEACK